MMILFRLERNSTGGWVLRAADDGDLAIQITGDSVVIQGIESIETFDERGHPRIAWKWRWLAVRFS